MKKMKLAFTIMLTTVLLIAGCSSGTKGNEVSSPTAESTGESRQSQDKISLHWVVPGVGNSNLPDPSKDFVLSTINQKFNVDLKLEYFPISDYVNKVNTMLAVTPPDMWRDATPDGGQKYALDGLLAEMSTIVTPDTMPNYFKYWINEEELKGYGTLAGNYVRAPIPYLKKSVRSYFIRKDWLDNLNLTIPQNYEEYLNVLRAFRNNDPDGNGKKDTYGFSLSAGGRSLGTDWPEYVKNGLSYGGFVKDKKYVDITLNPLMEQVIDDIVKLNEEDLVDPDWFLNKGQQHIEKAIQGKVGVVLGSTIDFAFDNNQQGIQYRTKELNPKAEWIPFTMFPNTPLRSENFPGNPFLFARSVLEKNPEKVKRTVEILDWLVSEEGYLLTHYGVEGKHFNRDGSNILRNVDAFNDDIAKRGDFLKIWSFFAPDDPQVYGLTVVDPRETEKDREQAQFLRSLPQHASLGTALIPPVGFELADFRKLQYDVQIKLVFDEKSGKNWPKYREELMTKHNGSELIQAYENLVRAAGKIE